jgi:hypothetical protein
MVEIFFLILGLNNVCLIKIIVDYLFEIFILPGHKIFLLKHKMFEQGKFIMANIQISYFSCSRMQYTAGHSACV